VNVRLANIADGLLYGAALAAGIYIAEQLRSPYSDLRLWLDGVLDRVREGVTR
jgi:hypothetical protein